MKLLYSKYRVWHLMPMTRFNQILHSILAESQKLVREHKEIAFVFDIDSTLFDVTKRSSKILELFAEQPKISMNPELKEKVSAIQITSKDWGIIDVLRKTGIEDEFTLREAKRFWREHFFSNNFLHLDQPYPGAVEFVKHVQNITKSVLYLTGRDQHRMRDGTIKSFEQHGFPYVNDDLLMKPHFTILDHLFKLERLKEIQSRFDRIYFFENEPFIIEHIEKELKNIKIIFMNSVHSGRAQTPTHHDTLHMSFY